LSESVRVSSKYQVVIPKAIREKLSLEKGEEIDVSLQGDTIVMRVKPKSFTQYTSGLHKETWQDTEATEYVEEERSRWQQPQET
jgi:AbrB family looped-hinge helix DNA binding protein